MNDVPNKCVLVLSLVLLPVIGGGAHAELLINGGFDTFTAADSGAVVVTALGENEWVHFSGGGSSPTLGLNTPPVAVDIPGWQAVGAPANEAGLFNPAATEVQPPSPNNLLFINGGAAFQYVSQTTALNVLPDTTYTLSFEHWVRTGHGGYGVEVVAGGNVLGTALGLGATGGFESESMVVYSGYFPGAVGHPLEVRIFDRGSGQTTFDDFSLVQGGAIPPPPRPTLVLDNEDLGFTVSADTTGLVAPDEPTYLDDRRWFSHAGPGGVGAGYAEYSFTNVPAGSYEVYANWFGQFNTDQFTTYTFSDDGGVAIGNHLNNHSAVDLLLADPVDGDQGDLIGFELLKSNVSITDGDFTVTVTVPTPNMFAFVDAIVLKQIPEPSTLVLAALGLLGLCSCRRRSRT